jgi:quercetin dioxygenase-like cupin family protein
MRRALILAVLAPFVGIVLLGLGGVPFQRANRPGGVVLVRPGDIQWTDYPGRPGVGLAMIEGDLAKPGPFLMRVKFPAHFKLAPHSHPGIEHSLVISGALRIGYGVRDDGPMETLGPGTILITPAGTPHFLATDEETIVQTHGLGPWGSTPVK